MPMNKPHIEFTKVDMSSGWVTPPGYPAGIKQKILASDLDERHKMGSRTRLLRFDPGTYTSEPFVHDHWEEVLSPPILFRLTPHRLARRILHLDPIPRAAGAVARTLALRDDALAAKLAGVAEDQLGILVSMCSFSRMPSAARARMRASSVLRCSIGSRRRSSPFSSIRSKA